MFAEQTVTLNNNVVMPRLGLGTYRAGPGKAAQQAVQWALATGYRLFDTALAYGNETDVGRAVHTSGLCRDEVFITSKLENDDHGFDATLFACDKSLANLGMDYLDLYLIHWPVPELRQQTWRALERLYGEGKCRAVGVSNYTIHHLQELLLNAEVVPAVNQVEFHPFLYQKELQTFCAEQGIHLEAYSPLVKATRLDHPVLADVAGRHGRTPAQVLVRWHLQHGVVAIPKSVQRAHIQENFAVWDFVLSAEEMNLLDSLNENFHCDWDPTHVP